MGTYLLSERVLSHDVSLHHHLLLIGWPIPRDCHQYQRGR